MSIGIYFAGKIGIYDWRHSLLSRATGRWRKLRDSKAPFDFNIGPHKLTYQGPFFTSCDHGCYHGEHSHGVGLDVNTGCPRDIGGDPFPLSRPVVFRRSLEAIDRSDCLFAFIDSASAFGTLVEIGYARARGKTVLLCFADKHLQRDMWFVSESCSILAAVDPDPYLPLLDGLNHAFQLRIP